MLSEIRSQLCLSRVVSKAGGGSGKQVLINSFAWTQGERPTRWFKRVVLLLLTLSAVALAQAQLPPPRPASTSANGDGRLWGTVVRHGQIVPGAEVQLGTRVGGEMQLSQPAYADAHGRFFVYPNPEADRLIVRHETGNAERRTSQLTNEFRIDLED